MQRQKEIIRFGRLLRSRVPLCCLGLLILLAFVSICPASSEPVEAVANTTNQYLPSTVNLTMVSGLMDSVEPTADGVFKKISTSIGVQVASADAFSVLLRGDTEMTGSFGNNTKINPVGENSTEATFGKNEWGYSWAEGDTAASTYNPVPGADIALVNNQETVNSQASKTYTLGFGVKVDNTIPADTYKSSVTVSVVAKPKTVVANNYSVAYNVNGGTGSVAAQTAQRQESSWSFTIASGNALSREGYKFLGWSENPVATEAEYQAGDTIALAETDPEKALYAVWKYISFNNITTMQGMTKDICANAKFGETARLEDTRDGKKYWVTKLADGNCWMTQNLDLDITSAGLTTANDSNINWNPNNPTKVGTLADTTAVNNTNSWDQGEYILSTPYAMTYCGLGLSGISACASGGNGAAQNFINVAGWTESDDPDFTEKNGSPIDIANQVYDAHYLIGNYYSFNAATAGTGASVTANGANASSSICPAGWEMPSSGVANNTKNSFYRLLVAQGMSAIPSTDGGATSAATNVTIKTAIYNHTGAPNEGNATMVLSRALATSPLFFVYSGEVGAYWDWGTYKWILNQAMNYPSNQGMYWSRSAKAGGGVHYFALNDYEVIPTCESVRYVGYSLRCLYPSS